ncbi:hypothetical protein B0H13DRAFT_2103567 [Mycena leptocephala]|nr:hypothetical protein B0H13DRAFT_2103567 [Mycena leptocephala]
MLYWIFFSCIATSSFVAFRHRLSVEFSFQPSLGRSRADHNTAFDDVITWKVIDILQEVSRLQITGGISGPVLPKSRLQRGAGCGIL